MKFIKVLSVLLFLIVTVNAKGLKAPYFELKDENGNIVKLTDLKGYVTVLIFWRTKCTTCKKDLPILSFLPDEYKGKPVKFYAIVIDTDDINEIKKAKEEIGFDLPVLIGDYKIVKDYNIFGTPIIYILRKDLTIGKRFFGETSLKRLKKYINKFLGE